MVPVGHVGEEEEAQDGAPESGSAQFITGIINVGNSTCDGFEKKTAYERITAPE